MSTTRRSFHRTVIQLAGAAIAGLFALPASVYLFFKPRSASSDDLVEIADVSELKVGEPQEVIYYRTRVDGWKRTKEKATTWVVKTPNDQVVAFSPQCPHLGCIYHWENPRESFICPCHDSAFSPEGVVTDGPAPRNLDRYVSKVEGGKLLVGSEIDRG